ncbi:MAG: ribosome maturation factor RimM [Pseudomonadota bacterium]|nr:ribosome maturation factor RimM [Pseudomonadota bacterium]
MRLKVFAENFGAYRSFNEGALTLVSSASGNNGLIVRFAEVPDRTAGEALRGTELTVPRASLPALGEGEYYHADLLGLPVMSATGEAIGTVVAIDDFGAGDVIEIERTSIDGAPGKRFMVPMNADAVPEWDDARLIVAVGFVE